VRREATSTSTASDTVQSRHIADQSHPSEAIETTVDRVPPREEMPAEGGFTASDWLLRNAKLKFNRRSWFAHSLRS
jgi:hypothetical protein